MQVKLTSSLRPSLWPNMNDLIKSIKLPLSITDYFSTDILFLRVSIFEYIHGSC